MHFDPLPLAGAFLVRLDMKPDERGFFARRFCAAEFKAFGLETDFVQRSISFNRRRGTLRGLHFQAPPALETKIVRCTRGAAFDVIVDLRRTRRHSVNGTAKRSRQTTAACSTYQRDSRTDFRHWWITPNSTTRLRLLMCRERYAGYISTIHTLRFRGQFGKRFYHLPMKPGAHSARWSQYSAPGNETVMTTTSTTRVDAA